MSLTRMQGQALPFRKMLNGSHFPAAE